MTGVLTCALPIYYLEIFQERLSRLKKVDLIILSLGQWQPHCPVVNLDPMTHFEQWQVNYFFPTTLLTQMIPFTDKKTSFLYNNFERAIVKDTLNSYNMPSLTALSKFIQIISNEQSWSVISANLPLYKSHQSGKLFMDLPPLEDLEEISHLFERLKNLSLCEA